MHSHSHSSTPVLLAGSQCYDDTVHDNEKVAKHLILIIILAIGLVVGR